MKLGFWDNENRNSALWQKGEIIETNGIAFVVVGYAPTQEDAISQLQSNPEFVAETKS